MEASGQILTFALYLKQIELIHLECFIILEDQGVLKTSALLLVLIYLNCKKIGLMGEDFKVTQAMSEACSVKFGEQPISFLFLSSIGQVILPPCGQSSCVN